MNSVISKVEKKSPLFLRVKAGDELVSINGNPIEDILDYEYWEYGARLDVTIRNGKGEKTFRVRKGEGKPLGLVFDEFLMDKPHHCTNHCIFCFIDQLPKGLRSTLYFKDDDARLSFLTGSYITLTNLTEREIDRILQLKISPLNISVHATEPELRAKMLGTPKAASCYELMSRMAEAHIEMNCQVVVCPEINDGENLQRTMDDLLALYPAVNSVSVVPVGLTKHREKLFELKAFNKETAEELIRQVDSFGDQCVEKYGCRIFYCADELYLKAEMDIPEEEYYDGYPQIENGVGLMRSQEEEFRQAMDQKEILEDFSIATGVAAAPYMRKLLKMAGSKAEVYAIENDFFGHSVDVAGLVTGQDLLKQLEDKALGKRLLIPQVMVRAGDVFLDDITVADVEKKLNVKVIAVKNDGFELYKQICKE